MRSSDERFRAILRGRREIRRVPLPGDDGDPPAEIGIRVLTEEEIDQCRAEAVQHVHLKAQTLKALKLSADALLDADPDLLEREQTRLMIYRATLDVDSIEAEGGPQPFFVSPTAVRQADSVFVQTLWELYCAHQDYVNPIGSMGETEVEELIETLGKGQTAAKVVFGQCDAPTLRRLLLSMVSLLAKSRSGK